MSKVVINFKVDKTVKEEAQKIAKELGIPLSGIVNAQLRQLIRTRVFELNATPEMSPFLVGIVEEIEKDRKQGKNISQTRNLDEALEHLRSL